MNTTPHPSAYDRIIYEELEREIEQIRIELAPLQDRLVQVIAAQTEAAERLAAAATTDAELLRWMNTRTGHERFTSELHKLHSDIYTATMWSPTKDPNFRDARPGCYLTLRHNATPAEVESLADALVEFARRFMIDMPAEWDGRVFADILAHDAGERHSWQIWYDPTTRSASLVDARRFSRVEPYEGELTAVLGHACKVAWAEGSGPDDAQ